MLKELIYTTIGASTVMKDKIEEEMKILEKKGKIKKEDAKELMKKLEKKGKLEDKRLKKEIRGHLKELINELGLVTKKDLKKFKEELKKQ